MTWSAVLQNSTDIFLKYFLPSWWYMTSVMGKTGLAGSSLCWLITGKTSNVLAALTSPLFCLMAFVGGYLLLNWLNKICILLQQWCTTFTCIQNCFAKLCVCKIQCSFCNWWFEVSLAENMPYFRIANQCQLLCSNCLCVQATSVKWGTVIDSKPCFYIQK